MYLAEKARCKNFRRKTSKHAGMIVCILTALMLMGCGNKENMQQAENTVEEGLTQEIVTRETEQITEAQEFEKKKSEAIEEYMNSLTNITLAVDCSKSYDATEFGLQIELESARPDVVEVSGTEITAKAPGLAEISCTVEGQTKSFEVVVTQPEINTTDIVKTVGQSEQIWFYGTEGKPIFKSENPAIASVSEDGIITAEPTGIGQSTNILAEVDGKEFTCKVTVEAIPQLQSMYKLTLGGDSFVGYTEDGKSSKVASWNAEVSNIATDVAKYKDVGNLRGIQDGVEFAVFVPKCTAFSSYSEEDYINLGDTVFPVYRISSWEQTESIQIVLAGTSQNANVWVKEMERLDENGEPIWKEARCTAQYIPCEEYGIIELSNFKCNWQDDLYANLYFYVWIEIGDYQTRLTVGAGGPRIKVSLDEESGTYDAEFVSDESDAAILSFNVYDEFMEEVPKASDIEERQAALESKNANSSFGYIQSDFLGAVGEEMQNQAIEKIASIALKALIGF